MCIHICGRQQYWHNLNHKIIFRFVEFVKIGEVVLEAGDDWKTIKHHREKFIK